MMHDLNWVDYIILAIFLLSIITGLSRGIVKEVISLITLIVAITVATMFAQPLSATFTNTESVQSVVTQTTTATGVSTATPVSYAAIGLSFGLIFAGTILVGALIGAIINLAFQVGILGIGNRIFGGAFGLCRGYIISLVLIFLVQLTAFGSDDFWKQSKLVGLFQPSVQWLASIVSPSLDNLKHKLDEKLKDVNTNLQSTTKT